MAYILHALTAVFLVLHIVGIEPVAAWSLWLVFAPSLVAFGWAAFWIGVLFVAIMVSGD